MEIDSLKSNWKKSGADLKNQQELLSMTEIKNHPSINRLRNKFIIETILITTFLLVYYDGFDGGSKPIWANTFLVVSTIAYIILRILGWLTLQNPIRDKNLKKSLHTYLQSLKRIANLIVLTSFLFGLSIILFFSSTIDFTNKKYVMLIGLILSLGILVYRSHRNWFARIKKVKDMLVEFGDSPPTEG